MSTRAQWAEGIPDLYDEGRLDDAKEYLTIAEVSELTGFSPGNIRNALSRPVITSQTNALGPLSRPAVRIGSRPLYSREQAEKAKGLRVKPGDRKHFGGGDESLPGVTFEEAERAGLVSMLDIAQVVGLHEQTVRGWARTSDDFPDPVGLRERHPAEPKGAPSVVYERRPVLEWALANRKIAADA
jgi:hypothetical protein